MLQLRQYVYHKLDLELISKLIESNAQLQFQFLKLKRLSVRAAKLEVNVDVRLPRHCRNRIRDIVLPDHRPAIIRLFTACCSLRKVNNISFELYKVPHKTIYFIHCITYRYVFSAL